MRCLLARLARLACLVGCHRWRLFPPAPGDPPAVVARRTCERCGRWELGERDPSGWSACDWRPL